MASVVQTLMPLIAWVKPIQLVAFGILLIILAGTIVVIGPQENIEVPSPFEKPNRRLTLNAEVGSLSWNRNGSQIAISHPNSFFIWDRLTSETRFSSNFSNFEGLGFSPIISWQPNGPWLIVADFNGAVYQFNTETLEETFLSDWPPHNGKINQIVWNRQGSAFISVPTLSNGISNPNMKLWEFNKTSGEFEKRVTFFPSTFAISASWDDNGEQVASIHINGEVLIWNVTVGDAAKVELSLTEEVPNLNRDFNVIQISRRIETTTLAYSTDGTYLAFANKFKMVIYDTNPWQIHQVQLLDGEPSRYSWLPNTKTMVMAIGSKLQFFNVETQQISQTIQLVESEAIIQEFEFSSNAKFLSVAYTTQEGYKVNSFLDIWQPVTETRFSRELIISVLTLTFLGGGVMILAILLFLRDCWRDNKSEAHIGLYPEA